jgi:septum formation protein
VPSPLILASASPRRRDLLQQAGYRFAVRVPDVVEASGCEMTAREIALYNATRKALVVARAAPGAVVLAADTVVALDQRVLGKPGSLEQAAAFLRLLSGRTHEVFSGVVIAHHQTAQRSIFSVTSRVTCRTLSEKQIAAYVARIDPLDKAGGYAAQGSGAEIIASIEGSFSNVVGLPMEETVPALRRFGLEPTAA